MTRSGGESTDGAAPSATELVARLEALQDDVQGLRRRMEGTRPSRAVIALRVALLFGIPIAAAVAVYLASSSILFAILALIGALVATIMIALRLSPTPAHMRPGTRAFEANLTASLLRDVISERRTAQLEATDADERSRLGREIAFLSRQLDDNLAIVAANDASRGRGSIGFQPYTGD